LSLSTEETLILGIIQKLIEPFSLAEVLDKLLPKKNSVTEPLI